MSDTISTDLLTLDTIKQLIHEYLFSGKVLQHFYEYLLGSMLFATILAVVFGSMTYIVLRLTGERLLKPSNNS